MAHAAACQPGSWVLGLFCCLFFVCKAWAQDLRPKAQDPRLKTQSPKTKTQDLRPKTQDPRPRLAGSSMASTWEIFNMASQSAKVMFKGFKPLFFDPKKGCFFHSPYFIFRRKQGAAPKKWLTSQSLLWSGFVCHFSGLGSTKLFFCFFFFVFFSLCFLFFLLFFPPPFFILLSFCCAFLGRLQAPRKRGRAHFVRTRPS